MGGGCHAKRTCTNNGGTAKCDNCPAGYVNDGAKSCKAIRGTTDMECDASNGERWLSKFQAGTLKACEEACMNDPTEKCNSFTYYNHGSCSFFSTCCEKTRVVDNAHSE